MIWNRISLAVIGLVLAATGAATRAQMPTTIPAVTATLAGVPVVRLWPGDPPATRPFDDTDKLTGRGTPAAPAVNVGAIRYPSLMLFLPEPVGAPRAAAILCPGGGYAYESLSYEGVDVAKNLAANGIAGIVLRYRLPVGRPPSAGELPVSQQDVLRAIQLVRANAAVWHIDPARVGVIGFSAGGHLAATAATMYDQAPTLAGKAGHDATSALSARPDFAVLVYPVISMDPAITHGGSRKNLIGATADATLQDRFSADLHVTKNTPPLFIVHGINDTTVPVANAQRLSDAAEAKGVPHELLLFKKGSHGFGLGNNDETRTWFPKCLAWLASQKLIEAKP